MNVGHVQSVTGTSSESNVALEPSEAGDVPYELEEAPHAAQKQTEDESSDSSACADRTVFRSKRIRAAAAPLSADGETTGSGEDTDSGAVARPAVIRGKQSHKVQSKKNAPKKLIVR